MTAPNCNQTSQKAVLSWSQETAPTYIKLIIFPRLTSPPLLNFSGFNYLQFHFVLTEAPRGGRIKDKQVLQCFSLTTTILPSSVKGGYWLIVKRQPLAARQREQWSCCWCVSANRLRGLTTLYGAPAIKGHLRGDGASFCVSPFRLENWSLLLLCLLVQPLPLHVLFALWLFTRLASCPRPVRRLMVYTGVLVTCFVGETKTCKASSGALLSHR